MNAFETVFPFVPAETGNAGETDRLTNGEFLRAVFAGLLSDARPAVVSFIGNPSSAPGKVWFGRAWPGEIDEPALLPGSANNYFSLAVFRPGEAGRYRRQKGLFVALHAVMLNDLGSRVAMDRIRLPPSWLLETSPGNYQAGYLLDEPLAEGLAADRLMNAIVAAGLCDPDANGPRTRLARLPVAVNGKHQPPFACRRVVWQPDRRYSVDDLAAGLQLEIAHGGRPRRTATRPHSPPPGEGDSILIPRPDHNLVIVALRERGLYKAPLGGGRHDITCPWGNGHTGSADGGTAYFEPDGNWPIGGFECSHGHCAGRHVRDLLGFLGIEASEARMKSILRILPGEIHRVVDAAERELAQSRRHYQRGGLIVSVVTDPGTRETRIQGATPSALLRSLAEVALWDCGGRSRAARRCRQAQEGLLQHELRQLRRMFGRAAQAHSERCSAGCASR